MILFIPLRNMKMNITMTMTRKFRAPLFLSLFVFLPFLAAIAHARTLSGSTRRYGLMHASDDSEMLTGLPPPSSPAALQKITQYHRPSAPSPPLPESSESPDQSTIRSASPCLAGRLCSGFKRNYYGKTISSTIPPSLTSTSTSASASASQKDSSFSTAKGTVCNYKIRSMIDYNKKSSAPPPPPPPPPPSSSKSPITLAKPSPSPPPSPSSSKSPVQISYNPPHIPTIASA